MSRQLAYENTNREDELAVERMLGEGCPNDGPFFWHINYQRADKHNAARVD